MKRESKYLVFIQADTLKFDVPMEKKSVSVINNNALDAVARTIYK